MCDKHEFFFEFDKAFTGQLIEKFEASPEHPLTEDVGPKRNGIYALYREGEIVYAGKALPTTLRRRLGEHTRKIAGRRNISVDEMTCRFLAIDSDWFVGVLLPSLCTPKRSARRSRVRKNSVMPRLVNSHDQWPWSNYRV